MRVFHSREPGALAGEGQPGARREDPEAGAGVVARPRGLRGAYTGTVRRSIREWRAACRGGGIAYHHVLTTTPFGHVLRAAAARQVRRG